jgi:hypothetical protein
MSNLIEKFKNFPDELIQKIINYTDVIVYRNGKYINRLERRDIRYSILAKGIPKPIRIGPDKVILKLLKYTDYEYSGYIIEYNFKESLIRLSIKFVAKQTDGFDSYLNVKSKLIYIYDINNKWSKLIDYYM